MTQSTRPTLIGEGTSEGQPVACYDATSIERSTGQGDSEELSHQLEQIREDYFETRAGDPSAIVAVLVATSSHDVNYFLRFVAAHGPLDGCGEATLFATRMCTDPTANSAVNFDTPAGVIVGRNLGAGRIAVQMPAVASASSSRTVTYRGTPIRIRSAVAGGNRFAAVTAEDLGVRFDHLSPRELTAAGTGLLTWLREHSSSSAASPSSSPDMLIITEPVAESSTQSAVIWGNAVLNRGPCGTGTCVRYVLAVEDGEVKPGSKLIHSSPFGNSFEARSVGAGLQGATTDLRIVLSGHVRVTRTRRTLAEPRGKARDHQ